MSVCRILQQEEPGTVKNRGAIQLLALFFIIDMLCAAAAVCLYHTASLWRCGSYGTTVAVIQGIRFVTTTNFSVGVLCERAILNRTREIATHTFQQHPRSTAPTQQQQQQQQRYNTSEPRNVHIHRDACVPISTCDTPGISSLPHLPYDRITMQERMRVYHTDRRKERCG